MGGPSEIDGSTLALAGVLVCGVMAPLLLLLGRARARARARARTMTADLAAAKCRAEEMALRLQEQAASIEAERERMDLALSGTGMGALDWNPQTGEVHYDARWLALVGETQARPHVDEWTSRIHPDDHAMVMTAIAGCFSGAIPAFDCTHRMRHRDGSWRWITDRGLVVARDAAGSPARVVATHADITERKHAEEASRSVNEILERTGAMAHVGGWELDAATGRLTWSAEVYRIHEVPVGTTIPVDQAVAFYAPDARQQISDAVEAGLERGEGWDLELPLVTARGRSIWVRARGEAVYEGDRIAKLCGAFQDVTEQRAVREELARRVREMELLRDAADAASRAKSEFLANMSHEIRTPLTAILGYADLLREDGDVTRAPERRLQTIDTIVTAGQHLLTVINDILDLSKIEAGKMSVDIVETPLVRLLAEVEGIIRSRTTGKDVALEFSLATPVPDRVMTDPTRLRQILMNLVGNAAKFTNVGRVQVTASVGLHEGLSTLVLDVEDTGPGVGPDQVDRLFAAFSQADTTVTRQHGGTGLGLTITRRLARLLGGDVTLEWTEPRKGSRFRARLPLVRAPGAVDVSAIEPLERDLRSETRAESPVLAGRILLAEDGAVNQRLIAFHLRKAGADVDVADNGRIALERIDEAIAKGRPYDLVVSDMQMPELDGYSLARRLRERTDRVPIVALTAHAMAEDRERCLAAGCDDYLSKPIDKALLLQTCKHWLDEAASRRSASRAPTGSVG